ncbi:hypothetical protein F751_3496 [Auxenochlorella protothecoides]|uniref:Uncharacterized protein n=2 Tax=Auxenochlorella protothecoides TaxID=3075 RepID=A0A087SSG2_AUXPR|nr:hypothetical protein F751_3496 [Auxenochlorella protothecoides]KFM28666.1 hypothetical protein F751_3496 [Auxenochlorella protothecoides]
MHVPAFEGRGGHSTEVRGGEHVLPASKSTKRRRGVGPQEACPFCGHLYTVRDGLSAKANTAGQRLHQRKCQCRSKTPPCRNCPNCKVDAAVMAITDPDAQMAACEAKGCAICSCQCPSVGKWIEGDAASRKAFKERTERRAEQLHLLSLRLVSGGGAAGAGSDGLPCDPAALLPHIACPAHSGGWSVKRLPADIRSSLSALQQEAAANVVELARSVFEPALGPPALQAVCSFLSAQCVSSLDDLEFLQLEWMVTALHPHGIPVLLLNKFLTLGRRGARQGAGLADAQVPA